MDPSVGSVKAAGAKSVLDGDWQRDEALRRKQLVKSVG
jgi:hypothetical protein